MAVGTAIPTNTFVYSDAGTLVAGLARNFLPGVNGYVGTIEDKVQRVQAYLEAFEAYVGFGAISGGALAAATGLNLTHGTLSAHVGNIVTLDAIGTIGGLTNGTLNYIWLRQDASWTVSTTPNVPGTADGHGTALYWGTALTAGGTVSGVNNERPWFMGTIQAQKLRGHQASGSALCLDYGTINTNSTALQALGTSTYTMPYLECLGTAVGTAQVTFPAHRGATWLVYNKGTAALNAKVSGQSGTLVPAGTASLLFCDGTDIRLVS